MSKSNIYSIIGAPFVLSVFGAYSGLSNKTPWQFLGCAAAAIVTLPLMPFAMLGSEMEEEESKAEFEKATANLPRVMLPRKKDSTFNITEAASIDGPDENGIWWVDPFYYLGDNDEGECHSEEEARKFLIDKGYMEVVALDYPNHLGTHWIKKEDYHG